MGLPPVTFARAWRQGLRGSSRTPFIAACFLWFGMPAYAQQAPPVIAAVEPGAGPPGTLLRITGRKLCAQTRVLLGQTELPIELCTPSVVTARVPRGAESAALVLETSAGKLEGPRVRVLPAPPAPVIRRISPTRGGPGTLVAL